MCVFILPLMQVGPIPYGEIFGEKFGYATIKEFVSYMDEYRLSSWIERNHTSFKAPLYVFDSEMLKEHFIGHYDLKGNAQCTPPFPKHTQFGPMKVKKKVEFSALRK